ncbi:UvrD-helicase domain-containing protein, partial [Nocardia noduli]|uniref:UvrD-helicase domain-containing protein n=1 Tax=Nocardia noduli TaxID=2815722 RepID=UPI001C24ABD6
MELPPITALVVEVADLGPPPSATPPSTTLDPAAVAATPATDAPHEASIQEQGPWRHATVWAALLRPVPPLIPPELTEVHTIAETATRNHWQVTGRFLPDGGRGVIYALTMSGHLGRGIEDITLRWHRNGDRGWQFKPPTATASAHDHTSGSHSSTRHADLDVIAQVITEPATRLPVDAAATLDQIVAAALSTDGLRVRGLDTYDTYRDRLTAPITAALDSTCGQLLADEVPGAPTTPQRVAGSIRANPWARRQLVAAIIDRAWIGHDFTEPDLARIHHAVEEHTHSLYRPKLNIGEEGAVRYTAETYVERQFDRSLRPHLWQAVAAYVAAHRDEVLTSTETQLSARRAARTAAGDKLRADATAALLAEDPETATDLLDDTERVDPGAQSSAALRRIVLDHYGPAPEEAEQVAAAPTVDPILRAATAMGWHHQRQSDPAHTAVSVLRFHDHTGERYAVRLVFDDAARGLTYNPAASGVSRIGGRKTPVSIRPGPLSLRQVRRVLATVAGQRITDTDAAPPANLTLGQRGLLFALSDESTLPMLAAALADPDAALPALLADQHFPAPHPEAIHHHGWTPQVRVSAESGVLHLHNAPEAVSLSGPELAGFARNLPSALRTRLDEHADLRVLRQILRYEVLDLDNLSDHTSDTPADSALSPPASVAAPGVEWAEIREEMSNDPAVHAAIRRHPYPAYNLARHHTMRAVVETSLDQIARRSPAHSQAISEERDRHGAHNITPLAEQVTESALQHRDRWWPPAITDPAELNRWRDWADSLLAADPIIATGNGLPLTADHATALDTMTRLLLAQLPDQLPDLGVDLTDPQTRAWLIGDIRLSVAPSLRPDPARVNLWRATVLGYHPPPRPGTEASTAIAVGADGTLRRGVGRSPEDWGSDYHAAMVEALHEAGHHDFVPEPFRTLHTEVAALREDLAAYARPLLAADDRLHVAATTETPKHNDDQRNVQDALNSEPAGELIAEILADLTTTDPALAARAQQTGIDIGRYLRDEIAAALLVDLVTPPHRRSSTAEIPTPASTEEDPQPPTLFDHLLPEESTAAPAPTATQDKTGEEPLDTPASSPPVGPRSLDETPITPQWAEIRELVAQDPQVRAAIRAHPYPTRYYTENGPVGRVIAAQLARLAATSPAHAAVIAAEQQQPSREHFAASITHEIIGRAVDERHQWWPAPISDPDKIQRWREWAGAGILADPITDSWSGYPLMSDRVGSLNHVTDLLLGQLSEQMPDLDLDATDPDTRAWLTADIRITIQPNLPYPDRDREDLWYGTSFGYHPPAVTRRGEPSTKVQVRLGSLSRDGGETSEVWGSDYHAAMVEALREVGRDDPVSEHARQIHAEIVALRHDLDAAARPLLSADVRVHAAVTSDHLWRHGLHNGVGFNALHSDLHRDAIAETIAHLAFTDPALIMRTQHLGFDIQRYLTHEVGAKVLRELRHPRRRARRKAASTEPTEPTEYTITVGGPEGDHLVLTACDDETLLAENRIRLGELAEAFGTRDRVPPVDRRISTLLLAAAITKARDQLAATTAPPVDDTTEQPQPPDGCNPPPSHLNDLIARAAATGWSPQTRYVTIEDRTTYELTMSAATTTGTWQLLLSFDDPTYGGYRLNAARSSAHWHHPGREPERFSPQLDLVDSLIHARTTPALTWTATPAALKPEATPDTVTAQPAPLVAGDTGAIATNSEPDVAVIADEYSVLRAAARQLLHTAATDPEIGDIFGTAESAPRTVADPRLVEQLTGRGLLERDPGTGKLRCTPAGHAHHDTLRAASTSEPNVGDRVLDLSTGLIGVVGDHLDIEEDLRWTEIVTTATESSPARIHAVDPVDLTVIEHAALTTLDAHALYRATATTAPDRPPDDTSPTTPAAFAETSSAPASLAGEVAAIPETPPPPVAEAASESDAAAPDATPPRIGPPQPREGTFAAALGVIAPYERHEDFRGGFDGSHNITAGGHMYILRTPRERGQNYRIFTAEADVGGDTRGEWTARALRGDDHPWERRTRKKLKSVDDHTDIMGVIRAHLAREAHTEALLLNQPGALTQAHQQLTTLLTHISDLLGADRGQPAAEHVHTATEAIAVGTYTATDRARLHARMRKHLPQKEIWDILHAVDAVEEATVSDKGNRAAAHRAAATADYSLFDTPESDAGNQGTKPTTAAQPSPPPATTSTAEPASPPFAGVHALPMPVHRVYTPEPEVRFPELAPPPELVRLAAAARARGLDATIDLLGYSDSRRPPHFWAKIFARTAQGMRRINLQFDLQFDDTYTYNLPQSYTADYLFTEPREPRAWRMVQPGQLIHDRPAIPGPFQDRDYGPELDDVAREIWALGHSSIYHQPTPSTPLPPSNSTTAQQNTLRDILTAHALAELGPRRSGTEHEQVREFLQQRLRHYIKTPTVQVPGETTAAAHHVAAQLLADTAALDHFTAALTTTLAHPAPRSERDQLLLTTVSGSQDPALRRAVELGLDLATERISVIELDAVNPLYRIESGGMAFLSTLSRGQGLHSVWVADEHSLGWNTRVDEPLLGWPSSTANITTLIRNHIHKAAERDAVAIETRQARHTEQTDANPAESEPLGHTTPPATSTEVLADGSAVAAAEAELARTRLIVRTRDQVLGAITGPEPQQRHRIVDAALNDTLDLTLDRLTTTPDYDPRHSALLALLTARSLLPSQLDQVLTHLRAAQHSNTPDAPASGPNPTTTAPETSTPASSPTASTATEPDEPDRDLIAAQTETPDRTSALTTTTALSSSQRPSPPTPVVSQEFSDDQLLLLYAVAPETITAGLGIDITRLFTNPISGPLRPEITAARPHWAGLAYDVDNIGVRLAAGDAPLNGPASTVKVTRRQFARFAAALPAQLRTQLAEHHTQPGIDRDRLLRHALHIEAITGEPTSASVSTNKPQPVPPHPGETEPAASSTPATSVAKPPKRRKGDLSDDQRLAVYAVAMSHPYDIRLLMGTDPRAALRRLFSGSPTGSLTRKITDLRPHWQHLHYAARNKRIQIYAAGDRQCPDDAAAATVTETALVRYIESLDSEIRQRLTDHSIVEAEHDHLLRRALRIDEITPSAIETGQTAHAIDRSNNGVAEISAPQQNSPPTPVKHGRRASRTLTQDQRLLLYAVGRPRDGAGLLDGVDTPITPVVGSATDSPPATGEQLQPRSSTPTESARPPARDTLSADQRLVLYGLGADRLAKTLGTDNTAAILTLYRDWGMSALSPEVIRLRPGWKDWDQYSLRSGVGLRPRFLSVAKDGLWVKVTKTELIAFAESLDPALRAKLADRRSLAKDELDALVRTTLGIDAIVPATTSPLDETHTYSEPLSLATHLFVTSPAAEVTGDVLDLRPHWRGLSHEVDAAGTICLRPPAGLPAPADVDPVAVSVKELVSFLESLDPELRARLGNQSLSAPERAASLRDALEIETITATTAELAANPNLGDPLPASSEIADRRLDPTPPPVVENLPAPGPLETPTATPPGQPSPSQTSAAETPASKQDPPPARNKRGRRASGELTQDQRLLVYAVSAIERVMGDDPPFWIRHKFSTSGGPGSLTGKIISVRPHWRGLYYELRDRRISVVSINESREVPPDAAAATVTVTELVRFIEARDPTIRAQVADRSNSREDTNRLLREILGIDAITPTPEYPSAESSPAAPANGKDTNRRRDPGAPTVTPHTPDPRPRVVSEAAPPPNTPTPKVASATAEQGSLPQPDPADRPLAGVLSADQRVLLLALGIDTVGAAVGPNFRTAMRRLFSYDTSEALRGEAITHRPHWRGLYYEPRFDAIRLRALNGGPVPEDAAAVTLTATHFSQLAEALEPELRRRLADNSIPEAERLSLLRQALDLGSVAASTPRATESVVADKPTHEAGGQSRSQPVPSAPDSVSEQPEGGHHTLTHPDLWRSLARELSANANRYAGAEDQPAVAQHEIAYHSAVVDRITVEQPLITDASERDAANRHIEQANARLDSARRAAATFDAFDTELTEVWPGLKTGSAEQLSDLVHTSASIARRGGDPRVGLAEELTRLAIPGLDIDSVVGAVATATDDWLGRTGIAAGRDWAIPIPAKPKANHGKAALSKWLMSARAATEDEPRRKALQFAADALTGTTWARGGGIAAQGRQLAELDPKMLSEYGKTRAEVDTTISVIAELADELDRIGYGDMGVAMVKGVAPRVSGLLRDYVTAYRARRSELAPTTTAEDSTPEPAGLPLGMEVASRIAAAARAHGFQVTSTSVDTGDADPHHRVHGHDPQQPEHEFELVWRVPRDGSRAVLLVSKSRNTLPADSASPQHAALPATVLATLHDRSAPAASTMPTIEELRSAAAHAAQTADLAEGLCLSLEGVTDVHIGWQKTELAAITELDATDDAPPPRRDSPAGIHNRIARLTRVAAIQHTLRELLEAGTLSFGHLDHPQVEDLLEAVYDLADSSLRGDRKVANPLWDSFVDHLDDDALTMVQRQAWIEHAERWRTPADTQTLTPPAAIETGAAVVEVRAAPGTEDPSTAPRPVVSPNTSSPESAFTPVVAASPAVAVAGEKFAPTDQQQAVYDHVLAGLDVKVQAGAGAGKTSTLEGLARRIGLQDPNARIVYIAFNKSVQLEAAERMPANVESRTGHSIAFQWAPKYLRDRIDDKTALRRPDHVARHLSITRALASGEPGPLSITEQAMAVIRTVDTYATSAEDLIGRAHLPARIREMPETTQDQVVALAEKAWADLNAETGGALRLTRDHVRKMWALRRPDLTEPGSGLKRTASILFLDEGQDTAPVLAKVVADQRMRKVLVGDQDQAIYGFTGAADYLATALADAELPLTKSWRFGPEIADIGNRFLQLLDSNKRVEGGGAQSRITDPATMTGADAILVRSNGGAIAQIERELAAGRTVGVPKGVKPDLNALVSSARYLQMVDAAMTAAGSSEPDDMPSPPRAMHEDLAPFRRWSEVVEEAENGEDPKLVMLVGMVERTGVDNLDDIVRQVREHNGTTGLDKVTFRDTAHGLIAEGDTYPHRSILGRAGFDRHPHPEKLRSTSGKNKGEIREVWMATGTAEQRRAARAQALKLAAPDVIVSTAHKAKGLEWDRVRIGDDFRGPTEHPVTGKLILPAPEELRLAYVAVTRARTVLDPGSLAYVYDHTTIDGGTPTSPPRPDLHTLTQSPSSETEFPLQQPGASVAEPSPVAVTPTTAPVELSGMEELRAREQRAYEAMGAAEQSPVWRDSDVGPVISWREAQLARLDAEIASVDSTPTEALHEERATVADSRDRLHLSTLLRAGLRELDAVKAFSFGHLDTSTAGVITQRLWNCTAASFASGDPRPSEWDDFTTALVRLHTRDRQAWLGLGYRASHAAAFAGAAAADATDVSTVVEFLDTVTDAAAADPVLRAMSAAAAREVFAIYGGTAAEQALRDAATAHADTDIAPVLGQSIAALLGRSSSLSEPLIATLMDRSWSEHRHDSARDRYPAWEPTRFGLDFEHERLDGYTAAEDQHRGLVAVTRDGHHYTLTHDNDTQITLHAISDGTARTVARASTLDDAMTALRAHHSTALATAPSQPGPGADPTTTRGIADVAEEPGPSEPAPPPGQGRDHATVAAAFAQWSPGRVMTPAYAALDAIDPDWLRSLLRHRGYWPVPLAGTPQPWSRRDQPGTLAYVPTDARSGGEVAGVLAHLAGGIHTTPDFRNRVDPLRWTAVVHDLIATARYSDLELSVLRSVVEDHAHQYRHLPDPAEKLAKAPALARILVRHGQDPLHRAISTYLGEHRDSIVDCTPDQAAARRHDRRSFAALYRDTAAQSFAELDFDTAVDCIDTAELIDPLWEGDADNTYHRLRQRYTLTAQAAAALIEAASADPLLNRFAAQADARTYRAFGATAAQQALTDSTAATDTSDQAQRLHHLLDTAISVDSAMLTQLGDRVAQRSWQIHHRTRLDHLAPALELRYPHAQIERFLGITDLAETGSASVGIHAGGQLYLLLHQSGTGHTAVYRSEDGIPISLSPSGDGLLADAMHCVRRDLVAIAEDDAYREQLWHADNSVDYSPLPDPEIYEHRREFAAMAYPAREIAAVAAACGWQVSTPQPSTEDFTLLLEGEPEPGERWRFVLGWPMAELGSRCAPSTGWYSTGSAWAAVREFDTPELPVVLRVLAASNPALNVAEHFRAKQNSANDRTLTTGRDNRYNRADSDRFDIAYWQATALRAYARAASDRDNPTIGEAAQIAENELRQAYAIATARRELSTILDTESPDLATLVDTTLRAVVYQGDETGSTTREFTAALNRLDLPAAPQQAALTVLEALRATSPASRPPEPAEQPDLSRDPVPEPRSTTDTGDTAAEVTESAPRVLGWLPAHRRPPTPKSYGESFDPPDLLAAAESAHARGWNISYRWRHRLDHPAERLKLLLHTPADTASVLIRAVWTADPGGNYAYDPTQSSISGPGGDERAEGVSLAEVDRVIRTRPLLEQYDTDSAAAELTEQIIAAAVADPQLARDITATRADSQVAESTVAEFVYARLGVSLTQAENSRDSAMLDMVLGLHEQIPAIATRILDTLPRGAAAAASPAETSSTAGTVAAAADSAGTAGSRPASETLSALVELAAPLLRRDQVMRTLAASALMATQPDHGDPARWPLARAAVRDTYASLVAAPTSSALVEGLARLDIDPLDHLSEHLLGRVLATLGSAAADPWADLFSANTAPADLRIIDTATIAVGDPDGAQIVLVDSDLPEGQHLWSATKGPHGDAFAAASLAEAIGQARGALSRSDPTPPLAPPDPDLAPLDGLIAPYERELPGGNENRRTLNAGGHRYLIETATTGSRPTLKVWTATDNDDAAALGSGQQRWVGHEDTPDAALERIREDLHAIAEIEAHAEERQRRFAQESATTPMYIDRYGALVRLELIDPIERYLGEFLRNRDHLRARDDAIRQLVIGVGEQHYLVAQDVNGITYHLWNVEPVGERWHPRTAIGTTEYPGEIMPTLRARHRAQVIDAAYATHRERTRPAARPTNPPAGIGPVAEQANPPTPTP